MTFRQLLGVQIDIQLRKLEPGGPCCSLSSKRVQVGKHQFIDLLVTALPVFSGLLQMAGGWHVHRGGRSFSLWKLTLVVLVEWMNYKLLGRWLGKVQDGRVFVLLEGIVVRGLLSLELFLSNDEIYDKQYLAFLVTTIFTKKFLLQLKKNKIRYNKIFCCHQHHLGFCEVQILLCKSALMGRKLWENFYLLQL